VVFLERPNIASQLQEQPFRLFLEGKEYVLENPNISTSIEEVLQIGKFDLALFALKSYDTDEALEIFKPYANQLPPFLCLSNGVENEAKISSAIGADKAIAGSVTTAVGRNGLGNITLEKLRGIGIAAGHAISQELVFIFNQAGLNAQFFYNAADMKWSKMLTNLISNSTSAILDMSPSDVFNHPGLYYLEIKQLKECLQVMKAQKINIVNLPGTPVKALAFAVKYLPLQISRPLLRKAVSGGRGEKMPSFYIDLHSGRGKSEVEYLNGAVVRYGEKYNIPTPANLLLNSTLQDLTYGRSQLSDYHHNPARLLSDF
jgi:2-dehydropantoate 2-reductase